ncbi:hypothetical protein T552_00900 [Pneumocystis carinii B80]|uniref:Cation efflux protein transmembrane domain-containing protein n=1 Tax=Pneumocystis carinii (strain B80) TaxID=1408658 RepID=A0A0W4ZMV2_PNEC8|nr:hypothetical protein T552_00900 [Pneumocystis carinii B80]KTW29692.1 hypothetical protein T552_00900 [Pneumocystis carinii B80]
MNINQHSFHCNKSQISKDQSQRNKDPIEILESCVNNYDTIKKNPSNIDNKQTSDLLNNKLKKSDEYGFMYSFPDKTTNFQYTLLFISKIRSILKNTSKKQKNCLILCFCHFIIAFLIWNFKYAPFSLTTLGSIIIYDAINMLFIFFLNIYEKYEAWHENTIKHPFGLKRLEVLGKFSMAIFSLYMSINSFKNIMEHSIIDLFSERNILKRSEFSQMTWTFSFMVIVISIIITTISAIYFNNRFYLTKGIFSLSTVFPALLDLFYLKSIIPLFIFLFMILVSPSTINTFDKYMSLLFEIPMCILRYIVIKKSVGILILSFPEENLQTCIKELEKETLIHSVKLAYILQPYFSFYIASFNISTKCDESMNFKIQEFINNILYRNFKELINNYEDENILEINVSIERISI